MRGSVRNLTVARLRALLRVVTELVAVTTLHLLHVRRLGTVPRRMPDLVAVAALGLAWLRAVSRHVALLAAVVASSAASLGAVLGEVTDCEAHPLARRTEKMERPAPTLAALPALDVLGRTRLGTLFGVVPLLAAVAAGEPVYLLLLAYF